MCVSVRQRKIVSDSQTCHSANVMECVLLVSVLLQYIPTAELQADILTKALSVPLFFIIWILL